jgi:hypothetical protein
MIKREAKFSILFRHWIMAHSQMMPDACAIEMKQSRVNSISFSCVKDSQVRYAEAIKSGGKGVLIRVMGGGGEPDYIWMYKKPAYVAVQFPHCFCLIDITAWEKEKQATVKRKSLVIERAKAIAMHYVEF